MTKVKKAINAVGLSRVVVSAFLLVLILMLPPLGIDAGMTYADILVRVGMFGYLVLAMMISVNCGAGLNFGLPIGILCGLLGGSVACQFNWKGAGGLFLACLCSVPLAMVCGYFYGKLLNKIKGSEMAVGNYLSFSLVYIMCIAWLVLPYNNAAIIWPMAGKGLRNTLSLDGYFSKVLDNFLKIDFKKAGVLQNNEIWKNFSVPTGLLLFFAVGCLLMWLFMKTKIGIQMRLGGTYQGFSRAMGISDDKVRVYGLMASMVLAAVGINVYSQSYGFYQFYTAPLKMAFPAMAALLIGGATTKKATVFDVIFGLFIYQGLLTLATPIVNILLNSGSISEVMRTIVQNGIILYALTKIRSNGGE